MNNIVAIVSSLNSYCFIGIKAPIVFFFLFVSHLFLSNSNHLKDFAIFHTKQAEKWGQYSPWFIVSYINSKVIFAIFGMQPQSFQFKNKLNWNHCFEFHSTFAEPLSLN